jgi:hypothetical protein
MPPIPCCPPGQLLGCFALIHDYTLCPLLSFMTIPYAVPPTEQYDSELDRWSFASAEECSGLYRAGSVISVHSNSYEDGEEETDGDTQLTGEDDRSTGVSALSHGTAKAAVIRSDEHSKVWTPGARKRHIKISTILADWFDMLSRFGYLS